MLRALAMHLRFLIRALQSMASPTLSLPLTLEGATGSTAPTPQSAPSEKYKLGSVHDDLGDSSNPHCAVL